MSIEIVTRQEAEERAKKKSWTLMEAKNYLEANPNLRMAMPENWRATYDQDGFFLEWIETHSLNEG